MTFEKELEAPSEDEGFARVDALPSRLALRERRTAGASCGASRVARLRLAARWGLLCSRLICFKNELLYFNLRRMLSRH